MYLHNVYAPGGVFGVTCRYCKANLQTAHLYICELATKKNAVSLFGGMTIHDDEIKELTSYCTKYFRAYSWFLRTVKPTT